MCLLESVAFVQCWKTSGFEKMTGQYEQGCNGSWTEMIDG